MTNPYKPDTQEYILLNNLIECIDNIQDYAGHCEPDGKPIDCKIINAIIKAHGVIHNEAMNNKD